MTRKRSQQHDAQRKPSWHVRWKTMSRAVGMEIREHKSSFAVYVVLRMLVLAMAILQFFNGDYENVFLCIQVWQHNHSSSAQNSLYCHRHIQL